MIPAIKRKLFPACSDSNCFPARVSTKAVCSWKIQAPFGEEAWGMGGVNLYGKRAFFCCSVFCVFLPSETEGSEGLWSYCSLPFCCTGSPKTRDPHQPSWLYQTSENPSIPHWKAYHRTQVCNPLSPWDLQRQPRFTERWLESDYSNSLFLSY